MIDLNDLFGKKRKDIEVAKAAELALDDEEMRKQNTRELVGLIKEGKDFFVQQKKNARVTKWYFILIIGFMVVMIGGSMLVVVLKSGSPENAVDNILGGKEDVNKRIVCAADGQNLTFRIFQGYEAYYVKQVFNDTECHIRTID